MSELAYFRRRLATAQQAKGLAPQSRFNLASSTVDDDALEESVAQFGGPPAGESGFGTADILNEMLSKDPRYLPVGDIKAHQQSLLNMGYLPPGYQATGDWDPVSYAASRRADKDSLELVRSGKNFLAVPTKKFFEYMTYTIPSGVFEGIYGAATGVMEDFARTVTNPVEVAQEGGAAGTALAGAGIGATIGSIVPGAGTAAGAAVGAIVGGAAGFFADLFDGDEEEEEGFWGRIWEAATPFDEIGRGDAKNLFAALSTAMTAATVLKAGSLALRGGVGARSVAGSLAAPSLAPTSAGMTIRQAGLREAFRMAGKGTVRPGIVNQVTQAAIRRPMLAGGIIGATIDGAPELLEGDFGGALTQGLRGAAIGATAGKLAPQKAKDVLLKGLERAPLRRLEMSGAGQVARAVYTPLSVAGIGAHVAGELPGTGVQKGIQAAPDLREVDIPGPLSLGDVLDWTVGTVVFPERLFPWRGREMSNAMKAMRSPNMMSEFGDALLAANPGMRKHDAVNQALTFLGKDKDGKYNPALAGANALGIRIQFGLGRAAESAVADSIRAGKRTITEDPGGTHYGAAIAEERSKIVSRIFKEAGDADPTDPSSFFAKSETAKKIAQDSLDNPKGFINYLTSIDGQGSGLEHVMQHRQAESILMRAAREARVGKTQAGKADDFLFTPALRDDPAKGVTGYQTQQMITESLGQYEEAHGAFRAAHKALAKAEKRLGARVAENDPLAVALRESGIRVDDAVADLQRRKLISEEEISAMRPISGQTKPDDDILERIRGVAEVARPEVPEMSTRLADEGLNRYIAISTGENMIFHDHIPYLLEVNGIAGYGRAERLFDVLGSVGVRNDRADIAEMRRNSIAATVDEALTRRGLDLGGKEALKLIQSATRRRYDYEYALSQGEVLSTFGPFVKRQKGGQVKRELFKVDPRDLTPEDIHDALTLDMRLDIDDPMTVANEIKEAIHEGASFGASMRQMPHPVHLARSLFRSLGIQGLPGLMDFAQTINVPLRKLPGKVGQQFSKKSYGFLPSNLRRAQLALNYSLSPMFDLSRMVEATSFGAMKGSLHPKYALMPAKSIKNREWRSPYGGEVAGDEAWRHAMQFGDEVFHGGRGMAQSSDELLLEMRHQGVLGFKPKEAEYAQAWVLAQKKLAKGTLTKADMEEIRDTVLTIHHYGSKQTTFGNSMHVVFFPYLFQKKQLEVIHDFAFGAAGRNLLIHEGFRRWYELGEGGKSVSDRFEERMEKHLPLAKELERLNNLAYGVSAGRFFLEGIMDRSAQGKVAQGLATFFLPAGVHQPAAEAAGMAVDAAYRQFFTPQVWMKYGERVTPFTEHKDLVAKLVPAYRDFQRFMDEERGTLKSTVTAATEGQAPELQYQEYSDAKRMLTLEMEDVAHELGYASWESLRSSEVGAPLREAVNNIDLELGSMFPTGAAMADKFTNMDKVKDRVIYEIANKDERTGAEEAILALGQIEQEMLDVAAVSGQVTQEEMGRMIAPILRNFAAGQAENRQFIGLWDSLFQYDYGPLRRIAA